METQALARQVQLAQHQARLAAGSQYNPAAVGQCMPQNTPWPPSQGYGTGMQGAQYGPNVPFSPSLPQNAPWPGNPVTPHQTIVQNLTPLGGRALLPADGSAVTATFFPTYGLYYIAGIRVCNECDEVDIIRVTTAGSDLARNAATFDSAAYNTIECFCPVDWGCISQQNPLNITAAAVGTPSVGPTLNFILFGTHHQGFNTCYPGAAAAIGFPPGGYGVSQAAMAAGV